MNYNRPIARLQEVFPAELLKDRKVNQMNGPLELQVNPKTKLVVSRIHGDILLEVEHPVHLKDGHGWTVSSQVRLEDHHIEALRAYLAERHDWSPEAA
jgi:hypothetical protein